MATEQAGQDLEKPEKQVGNSRPAINEPQIISYNLREEERPGELKVRYKIKIETGRKARELDIRQAAAIRELLIWARTHQDQTPTR